MNDSLNTMPIKTISPDEAVPKFVELLLNIHESIGSIVMPLAMVTLSLLAVIFIVGFVPGLRFLRSVGWIGFLSCCFGLFLYAAIPIVVGIIYGAGTSLSN
ncbi:hypothetical protein [Desulfofalx alkaliphila]|uniref:hypothetical protein n=1 Tax=Desulfofalx alkaliphila TaxID=105483 RepID=UPI0004E0D7B1|nr:hypothetical protein [Desulfofalx alkaliphila]